MSGLKLPLEVGQLGLAGWDRRSSTCSLCTLNSNATGHVGKSVKISQSPKSIENDVTQCPSVVHSGLHISRSAAEVRHKVYFSLFSIVQIHISTILSPKYRRLCVYTYGIMILLCKLIGINRSEKYRCNMT